MSDIISELRFYAAKQIWPKGLEPLAILLSGAADLLSEAEKREKDARRLALEEAAKVAEKFEISYAQARDKQNLGSPEHQRNNSASYAAMDITFAIRALQSEER